MKNEHHVRETLRDWLRTMFIYGQGRWQFMARHQLYGAPPFLAPLFITLAHLLVFSLFAFNFLELEFIWILPSFHFIGVTLALLPRAIRIKPRFQLFTSAIGVTVLTHLAYGLGMICQALKFAHVHHVEPNRDKLFETVKNT